MNARYLTALLASCLALSAQERSEALEHSQRTGQYTSYVGADVRGTFYAGMTSLLDSQTKQFFTNEGRGFTFALSMDYHLGNHWVVGGKIGGLWFNEKSVEMYPGVDFTGRLNGFQLGPQARYYVLDEKGNGGPYLTGAVTWTHWKEFLDLKSGDLLWASTDSKSKETLAPVVGLGWDFARHFGAELTYTRSRFTADYGAARNMDHLTLSLTIHSGGRPQ